jgi:hypothetical protein
VTQREHVCLPQAAPHVEIVVRDAEGEGLRGVRVWLLWDDGADWAVTGLKPDRSLGYADFGVETGVRYSVGVGEIAMPLLSGLQILACTDGEGGSARVGSWRIVVEQRPAEGTRT